MTIYFTSDLHHSHKNILDFTDRGKATVKEQHDVWLTCLWNKTVQKNDLVYHLGDLSFATKYSEISEFVSRLNGRIVLLKGNHDREANLQSLKDDNLIENWHMYKEIKVPLSTGEVQHINLFHFPIASFHKQGYGAWMLAGHSHGNYKSEGKSLDVGLDSAYNQYQEHKFFSLLDVENYMSQREVNTVDHHRNHVNTVD